MIGRSYKGLRCKELNGETLYLCVIDGRIIPTCISIIFCTFFCFLVVVSHQYTVFTMIKTRGIQR